MKFSASTWIVGIVLILSGTGAWVAKRKHWFGESAETSIEGIAASRGTLLISEIVRGNLKAKDSLSLRNEIEGRTTIITLVDEGSVVEAGDMIAELDTAELADRLVVQKIAEQNAAADYTKAREQLAIQRIQNESDLADARLQLEFAKMDLEKYTIVDGEWTHELKKSEETIKLAQEELSRAEARLEWTQKLFDQGFAQGLELEADRATVERAKVNVEQARRDKALKEQYGHRRQTEELRAAVETMQREVQKTEKQASARLADFEAAEASTKIRWDLEIEKLRKIEEQLGKGIITAPIRGMVVYARENSRWGASEPIQEGKELREREEIVTIPREGGMIVEASLHETVLKKVQLGQVCKITIDAIPSRSFQGRVQFVAVLADSNAWFANPNQRVYRSEVSIENSSPEMRPGMSCNVEILVAELTDVVYVPVQSVFLDGGQTVVFVKEGGSVETRTVEVGLDNSKHVEIKSGLKGGELVLLSAPPTFEPKPAPSGEQGLSDELRELMQRGGEFAMPAGMPSGSTMRPGAENGGAMRPGGASSGLPGGGRPRGEGAGSERSGAPDGSERARSPEGGRPEKNSAGENP